MSEPTRGKLIDLDEALARLKDAKPDPTDVLKMAVNTIDRRMNPYSAWEICHPAKHVTLSPKRSPEFQVVVCRLCQALILADGSAMHVQWHNTIEYRLRTLEGEGE